MQRILIIGCSGSGKSTLARRLGTILTLPVIHLDRLFWQEGWRYDRARFNALLQEALEGERWIIDGNYDSSLKHRLHYCDTVLFLDYPRSVCLFGVLRRNIHSYGKTRPDMADGCPERFDCEFLQYIWRFKKKTRPAMYEALSAQANCTIHIFPRRCALNTWLQSLSD